MESLPSTSVEPEPTVELEPILESEPEPQYSLKPYSSVDPSVFYPDLLVVRCDEVIPLGSVEVSAQCGTDEDKDGYLDDTFSTVAFTNTTRAPLLLTFGGKVQRYPVPTGVAGRGVEIPDYFVQRPSDSVLTTIEVMPEQTFKLSESASDPDAQFKYELYTGAVEYEKSEQEALSFSSCGDTSEISEEKVFGIKLFLSCYSMELSIHSETKGDVNNSELGRRNVVIKPNYSSVNVVYTLPGFAAYKRENVTLFSNPSQDYEVEVSIP